MGWTEGAKLLLLGQASGQEGREGLDVTEHYFPPMHPAVFNQQNGGGQTALAVAALHNRCAASSTAQGHRATVMLPQPPAPQTHSPVSILTPHCLVRVAFLLPAFRAARACNSASWLARADLVELLLRNGAVQDTIDDLGHTAHDVARIKGNSAAMKKLEQFNLQGAIAAARRRAEGQKTHLNQRELRKKKKEEKAALLRQKRREMG